MICLCSLLGFMYFFLKFIEASTSQLQLKIFFNLKGHYQRFLLKIFLSATVQMSFQYYLDQLHKNILLHVAFTRTASSVKISLIIGNKRC